MGGSCARKGKEGLLGTHLLSFLSLHLALGVRNEMNSSHLEEKVVFQSPWAASERLCSRSPGHTLRPCLPPNCFLLPVGIPLPW